MIYFDHAATTPVTEEVKQVIKYFLDYFGNPSSHYGIGFQARGLIEQARKQIADSINCEPENIYFTSGGSEGDNWACRMLRVPGKQRNRVITTGLEHHAVLHAASRLGEFRRVAPESDGIISFEHFRNSIQATDLESYSLASVMMVNNEIGTIQPVNELAEIAHSYDLYFHTDAVQAVGHIPLNMADLNVDMLTVSGHKFGAPKGIGFNYLKIGTPIRKFIDGGAQEGGMRAGTENLPYIMGLAQAFETANKCEHTAYIKSTRDLLWERILEDIPDVSLNGSMENRIDSNINVCIKGVDSQSLVALLDTQGICVSTGSACNSGNADPSHVLKAIGLSDEDANASIRITLGAENTWVECETFLKYLKYDVKMLREE